MDCNIFPGLNVGMPANEMPKDIDWNDDWSTSGHDDGFSKYCISANYESYYICVCFQIPQDIQDEYGMDIGLSDEEYQRHIAWGNEYRKNIFDQDIKIHSLIIRKKSP